MNKKISFAVSVLSAVFLLMYNYEAGNSLVPETQVSAVGQTEIKTNISTTTALSPISQIQEEFFVVSRVVDGDTIEVIKNGVKEKVRLIGINTPETVDPRKKVECFGKEAFLHMKELVTGKQVKLVSDDTQTKYDKYGRLLAYVYRDDGLFVNKHMISEGYAYEYTYKTPYLFQKEFKEAQLSAQAQQKGLWKAGVCE